MNLRPPTRQLLLLVFVLCVGCSGAGSEHVGDESAAVAKGGLDSPPVAVAPFLDGVLPPRTPNRPGSSTWTIGEAFSTLNLTDTLVIAPAAVARFSRVGRRPSSPCS